MTVGAGFCPSTSVLPSQHHSTGIPYHLYLNSAVIGWINSRSVGETFKKIRASSNIGKEWTDNHFYITFCLRSLPFLIKRIFFLVTAEPLYCFQECISFLTSCCLLAWSRYVSRRSTGRASRRRVHCLPSIFRRKLR